MFSTCLVFVAHLFVFVFKYLIKILTNFCIVYISEFLFFNLIKYVFSIYLNLSAIYELKKIE